MKEYTIGVEATVYDELRIVADSESEALAIAEKELKKEYYDYYTLNVDDIQELEE